MLQEIIGKFVVETFVLVIGFDFDRGDVFHGWWASSQTSAKKEIISIVEHFLQDMFSKVLQDIFGKCFVETFVLIIRFDFGLRGLVSGSSDNDRDDAKHISKRFSRKFAGRMIGADRGRNVLETNVEDMVHMYWASSQNGAKGPRIAGRPG